MDTRQTLLAAYRLLQEKYDFEIERMFLDASNYTLFGIMYLLRQMEFDLSLRMEGVAPKKSPIPDFGGNPKDGHTDRLQLNISHIVDQNGVPIVSQSYDGNTSDVTMNKDMLEFISREIDMKRCILVADCVRLENCLNDCSVSLPFRSG